MSTDTLEVCLVCVEHDEVEPCDGLCDWCDNVATIWDEHHYCESCHEEPTETTNNTNQQGETKMNTNTLTTSVEDALRFVIDTATEGAIINKRAHVIIDVLEHAIEIADQGEDSKCCLSCVADEVAHHTDATEEELCSGLVWLDLCAPECEENFTARQILAHIVEVK